MNIGPQRARPSSAAKIQAEARQISEMLRPEWEKWPIDFNFIRSKTYTVNTKHYILQWDGKKFYLNCRKTTQQEIERLINEQI